MTERSILSQLSTTLETMTDAYADACNVTAEAENTYLRAYHKAFITAADVPATIRGKHADNQENVVEAKCAHNLAAAAERAARAKVEEVKMRLTAAMSYTRFVREQT